MAKEIMTSISNQRIIWEISFTFSKSWKNANFSKSSSFLNFSSLKFCMLISNSGCSLAHSNMMRVRDFWKFFGFDVFDCFWRAWQVARQNKLSQPWRDDIQPAINNQIWQESPALCWALSAGLTPRKMMAGRSEGRARDQCNEWLHFTVGNVRDVWLSVISHDNGDTVSVD